MAKLSNVLTVWMNGLQVGHWTVQSGMDQFQYSESWVAHPQGRPLSLSLPFIPSNQSYRGRVVEFFFDNLLPDSVPIRERLARRFKTASIKPFDLLVELGRDCVGAIQLLPEGEMPTQIQKIEYKPLSDADVASLLKYAVSPVPLGQYDEGEHLRISLAGAQEKTALLRHNNQWCEPLAATPSTHIFKLPMGLVGNMRADMQQSVENEWLCAQIIAEFGLPVAQCEIAQFEQQKVLIVERFDRKLSANGQWLLRLPQEDFCQAMGISPLCKYQSDGGPSISDCMNLLNSSLQSRKDKMTFLKAQVVFWLLAATDGHAKNFSIQHLANNRYQLAPLYDVISVHPLIGNQSHQIPIQKVKMAMAVKGSQNYYHIQKIQRRHFIAQGKAVGFPEFEIHSMLDALLVNVVNVVERVEAILPEGFPQPLADAVLQGMLKQARRLQV